MTQPLILYFGSKQTCIKRPNRDELSFLMVFAFPEKIENFVLKEMFENRLEVFG